MLSSWLGLYYLSGMILGIWMVSSSSSWLLAWFGLELNLICFIPFLMKEYKKHSNSGSVYFLTQAIGSLMMLMFSLFFWHLNKYTYWVNIALFLKVGIAPFHFWYVQIAKELSWMYFLMLSTIQKIAPLILLSINKSDLFKMEFYFSIIISSMVGGLGGLYTLSLRELLVYSSVNHLAWMLIPLMYKNLFWVVYLVSYCILLSLIVWMFKMFSLYHLNQLTSVKISWKMKTTLIISMMSFGGLPPFIGFILKWGVLNEMNEKMNFLCLMILIFASVISLYYYIRISLSIALINSMNKIMFSVFFEKKISSLVIFINVVGLWVYPLMKMSF
uniref:NADH-ubiquinone oxidoreductase chain 2 n=1 Tax=Mongoloniscus sinensis TaxID=1783568 RepID=A0A3G3LKM9_9CRUS|nr:NADH dehydrogenase subunit 2 [Mongoloniscus sinensis]AYQ93278.1 NADH dehydrogenase subunit 2 [Mongoloniscus sinensis]